MSSTSKTQVERNGTAIASRSEGDVRKAFAPHWVSYTGMRRMIDASVANTRPR